MTNCNATKFLAPNIPKYRVFAVCAVNTNWRVRLITVHLLIKEASFIKKVNNIVDIKRSWYKLVSTRRSMVLSFPLHKTSLDCTNELETEIKLFKIPSPMRRSKGLCILLTNVTHGVGTIKLFTTVIYGFS